MNFLKFGAIDIGSNAIRLFIANIMEGKDGNSLITKSSIHRIPLRLGEDVFTTGEIGLFKRDNLLKTMQAFKLIMDVQQVSGYRACATSALREASNAGEIIAEIYSSTGIKIEVISGREEAHLLYCCRKLDEFRNGINYISMDLGGGSMDLTLFNVNRTLDSQSFKVGTVRMLNKQVPDGEVARMREWLTDTIKKYRKVQLIGSGGNINKLYKLANVKKDKPLSRRRLRNLIDFIEAYNYDDRMRYVELNPDRADVIVPAGKLYLDIMDTTGIKDIIVPVVGLVDGIVADVHSKFSDDKSNNKLSGLFSNNIVY